LWTDVRGTLKCDAAARSSALVDFGLGVLGFAVDLVLLMLIDHRSLGLPLAAL